MSVEGPEQGTLRRRMGELLGCGNLTARDLSRRMGIPEKEVLRHLHHVSRSLAAKGIKLRIEQSECLKCGFVFKDRSRFTRPGRCPRCRATHITEPSFSVSES